MNVKNIIKMSLLSVLAVSMSVGLVRASDHLLPSFTQSELDTNWGADRAFPTAGATSLSAFGRDNVAQLGIDASNPASGAFYRTEGIKTLGEDNFGNSVQVDLYLDEDWQDKAVRAGFWAVGDDGNEATTGTASRDQWFAILEFVHLETSSAGDSAKGDHEGWRVWDSAIGWVNLETDFNYGEWVTLGIELDTEAKLYRYTINGVEVGIATGGENFIREVFLNSYNYGLDTFPTLSSTSYAAHWHAGQEIVVPVVPLTKDECKKDGWKSFSEPTFKNQGECVSYVQSNQNAGKRN